MTGVQRPRRLRVAYREFDGFDRALRRQVDAFRQVDPTVEVELVSHPITDLYRLMVAGDGCRTGDWDLFLASSDWLPALIDSGRLRAVSPQLETDPPGGWPGGWDESLLTLQRDRDGTTYGLPYHDGPEVLMYRADLFDDPGERAAFHERFARPLTPPTSWTEFRQVAEFFTRPETGLAGCVVAAFPDGHNNVYDFLLQLWSRGGQVLDEGRAAFDGPAGVAGLEYLRELVRDSGACQPDPRAHDSVAAGALFATGAAAMTCNWAGFASVAELPGSPVAGRLRYELVPRGPGPDGRHVTLSVYWVATIPAGASDPALAWDLLRHLGSAGSDRITAEEGSIGCRLSTWEDPDIKRRFPCTAQLERLHRGAQTMPAIPDYPAVNEILSQAVDAVYTGRLTPADALAEAAVAAQLVLGARP